MGYDHPDHGETEYVEKDTRVDIKGQKCKRCGVIAPPGEEDEVFDNHDCDHYKKVREGITGDML